MNKTRDRLKTPVERETEAALKEAAKVRAKEDAQLFSRVFSTGDGKRVLIMIKDRCCYQSQITMKATGGVDVNGTLHNAALHKHYLWLRQHISPEILRDVENPLE